ncbi:MAG: helix-turn-helix transcriptional regulator [Microthrixaceae bacterium]|nr:helix-turn-helix transcriptional regulator [Microthrixaceae bacterium]
MAGRSLAKRVRAVGVRLLDGVTDPDEVADLTRQGTRPHRILPAHRSGTLRATADALAVGGVSFTRLCYGGEVLALPSDETPSAFLFPINLAGRAWLYYGREGVPIGPMQATIIPPYQAFRSEIAADFEQLIVVASRERVEHLMSRLSAGEVSELHLDAQTFELGAAATMQLEAVAVLAGQTGAIDTLHAERAADVALESVLLSIPGVRKLIPERSAAGSARLYRAMRHMLEHLAEPMTVTEVAESVHVSPRALQASFRHELGTTFTAWLRERRLERAWERLLVDPQATIADVALASGFGHLGEFSARFKAKFGMLPSAMMREGAAARTSRPAGDAEDSRSD